MELGDITTKELFWVINKFKRGKAAGPDNLPIDCCKEMDQHQLQIALDLINAYWNGEPEPIEYTQAQVILLFKKRRQNKSSELPSDIATKHQL